MFKACFFGIFNSGSSSASKLWHDLIIYSIERSCLEKHLDIASKEGVKIKRSLKLSYFSFSFFLSLFFFKFVLIVFFYSYNIIVKFISDSF